MIDVWPVMNALKIKSVMLDTFVSQVNVSLVVDLITIVHLIKAVSIVNVKILVIYEPHVESMLNARLTTTKLNVLAQVVTLEILWLLALKSLSVVDLKIVL